MTAKLDATGYHCVASLTIYDFRLCYKSRKSNIEAGALSKISWDRVID